jgi:NAD(P)-dependent dehydrogenase (short-subunit alcohol dehydrogenase family)
MDITEHYPFSVDAKEFAGKRVLVTGGTKGLGATMVRRFLLSGATVAITARSPTADKPAPVMFVRADLATASGAQTVVDYIKKEWGGVDILVNNAGAADPPGGGFEAISDEMWQNMLNVNLMSAIRLDRALVPGMIERGGGAVIHIGTLYLSLPQSDSALSYSAAKAALRAYSKGLSKAVAPRGVRVNMVSPGFIETEGAHGWIIDIANKEGVSPDEARKMIMTRFGGIPVGRTGRPAEIAELVAFLASDRGGFACGVNYLVDGGALPTV